MAAAVLFDVDGTLVDTNYLHVVAWWRAFGHGGHTVAMTDIHRLIGQGSDQLVESLLGHDDEQVRRAHTNFYSPYLEQLHAFPGVPDLLRAVAHRGLTVVLATSASEKEAARLREAIDADDSIDAVTDKGDVESSKPAPDLIEAALDAVDVEAADALFVGDTVWDVEAAKKVGVDTVAVLTGGISEAELRDAGAIEVHRDVRHLLENLDSSAIGRLAARAR